MTWPATWRPLAHARCAQWRQRQKDQRSELSVLYLFCAEAMQGPKSVANGLERLPVPNWNGSRRSYPTWKKKFNHWMNKYSQDKDEQLLRFRKAMPKGSWWTDQV